jgi:hypothetical protein
MRLIPNRFPRAEPITVFGKEHFVPAVVSQEPLVKAKTGRLKAQILLEQTRARLASSSK